MTEMAESTLGPAAQQFILHWGEMSSRWGINRSMAQIHALLYLSPAPLTAEEIADTLQIARSNVSTSLRELLAWGVVRMVHRLGDRRDHFETMKDAWEMLRVILEQRKRREIDPTVGMLRDCLGSEAPGDDYTRDRMRELLSLLTTLSSWYEEMTKLPASVQRKVLRMGSRIKKLAG
ncbi:MAG: MarR family transcriptional regulator [Acidobacteriota bacterium]